MSSSKGKANKEAKEKLSKAAKKQAAKKEVVHEIPASKTAAGRRPHKEDVSEPYQPSLLSEDDLAPQNAKAKGNTEVESEEPVLEAQAEAEDTVQETIIEGEPAEPKRAKIDLKEQLENVKGVLQMGTAIVKSQFPKPFEVAEKVVEDWKQDGDFSELPINQPLVQFYVGLGLRKVRQTEKDIEQKLESTGVLPVVRQQFQKAQKYFK